MINNVVNEKLRSAEIRNAEEGINVLRELVQSIVLGSLYRAGFFRNTAFYGGTCLRLFHGLARFSEDLDFCLTKQVSLDLNGFEKGLIDGLAAYGLDAKIIKKEEYDTGEILRRYVDVEVYELLKEFFGKELPLNRERKLSVKIEVDSSYISGADTEKQILISPGFASINCYDLPSLFSGKLHALLCRNWKNREKGRDYYDYMYYMQIGASYNLPYLQNKLASTLKSNADSFTPEVIIEMLKKRFENVDISSVQKDIRPFVAEDDPLYNSISHEVLLFTADYLKVQQDR